jgi:hypothetical protein
LHAGSAIETILKLRLAKAPVEEPADGKISALDACATRIGGPNLSLQVTAAQLLSTCSFAFCQSAFPAL